MHEHPVVTHHEWLAARRQLLEKEKAYTRLRDELSRERRALPWEPVDKRYMFEDADGRCSLAALFGPCSQLIVYHFMFAPDWEIGCKSCSFWADHFNGITTHLRQRDVALVAVSRAPLAKLQAQAARFGWTFRWLSAVGDDFNHDYQVSFTPDELARGEVEYNYAARQTAMSDLPGISVFVRDGERIFHSYSTYARGLDMLNAAYHYLDLTPKGRDEDGLPFPMSWVRHRIAYES